MSQWKVSTLSVGALIIPVLAVTAGALARNEAPAPETYAGAMLVLAGVAMSLFWGRGRLRLSSRIPGRGGG